MTGTLRVTSLDEAFINLAETSLMSVQFEVRLTGRLDVERLQAAMRTAVAKHPLARARLDRMRMTSTGREWEVPDTPDHLALEVTDEPAGVVRSRLQSTEPDLYHSPAFLATLVRDDEGDLFMLNLHHAAFDGMGAVRLMTSIARAYAGVPDELGGPPIEQARDLGGLIGSRNLTELMPRAKKIAADALGRKRVTRVAGDGGGAPGYRYGFATLALTSDETAQVSALRPAGATLNDLVLAAHALTIRRWNREHDTTVGDSISIMMPVNMRPSEWSTEVISNYASYLAIVVPATVSEDLAEATATVRDHTRPVKDNGAAGWIVDILDRGNVLPNLLKRNLQSLLPLVQNQFVETTVVSNVGRMTIPDFGDAGPVTEVWFSPPCLSAVLPLAVGVAGVGKGLQLVFRCDRRALSEEAVGRYRTMFRETLLGSG